jgi:hypothetical protein
VAELTWDETGSERRWTVVEGREEKTGFTKQALSPRPHAAVFGDDHAVVAAACQVDDGRIQPRDCSSAGAGGSVGGA